VESSVFASQKVLAAILLGLIIAIFVGVGGVAYWGFTSTGAAAAYGSVGIPGQAALQLPVGTVDITYTEDLTNQVIDVPAFGISIVAAATGQQALVSFRNGSASSVNGVSYAPVGTVQIPDAGKYRVDVTGASPSAPNPQLGFGISTQHTDVLIAALVTAGVLLFISGMLSILRWRTGRDGTPESDVVGQVEAW
jgi:hypothetical protein